jgi:hypothetical protein
MHIPNIPSVPNEMLHRVLNLGGEEKSLYCSQCGEYTRHVTVSYAVTKRPGFYKIVGRAMDYVPLAYTLTAGNPYACMKCKRLIYSGGLFSDFLDSIDP